MLSPQQIYDEFKKMNEPQRPRICYGTDCDEERCRCWDDEKNIKALEESRQRIIKELERREHEYRLER